MEMVLFAIFGLLAILGALTVILARKPVYAALGLMTTMFSLSVFYIVHLAHFVAAIQIIVYAGAVMTLFLFVIMLIGVDRAEDTTEKLPHQKPVVIGLGLVILVTTIVMTVGQSVDAFNVAGFDWVTAPGAEAANWETNAAHTNGTVENVGKVLFGAEGVQRTAGWALPFEAVSLLLIVAAVGAIALAFFRPLRRGEEDPQ